MEQHMDESTRADKAREDLESLSLEMDIARTLLFEVIERTQNFREGFYSYRRVNELSDTASAVLRTSLSKASTSEEEVLALEEFVRNCRNVLATLMTEIDRIDQ